MCKQKICSEYALLTTSTRRVLVELTVAYSNNYTLCTFLIFPSTFLSVSTIPADYTVKCTLTTFWTCMFVHCNIPVYAAQILSSAIYNFITLWDFLTRTYFNLEYYAQINPFENTFQSGCSTYALVCVILHFPSKIKPIPSRLCLAHASELWYWYK